MQFQRRLFDDDAITRHEAGSLSGRALFTLQRRRTPTEKETDLHATALAVRNLQDSGGRIVPCLAGTDKRARDGHRIHGWNTDHFEGNNWIVQYDHNRSIPPVGLSPYMKWDPKSGDLRGLTQFTPADMNRFGWEIGEMTFHGFLNQPSVGFYILESRKETDRSVLRVFPNALHIDLAGLYEYSIVNIESDTASGFGRSALEAHAAGVEVQEVARWCEQTIDEQPDLSYRKHLEDVARLRSTATVVDVSAPVERARQRTKQWILSGDPCNFCIALAANNGGAPISARAHFKHNGYSVPAPPAHDFCRCGIQYYDLDGQPELDKSVASRGENENEKGEEMQEQQIATLVRNMIRSEIAKPSEGSRCCGQSAPHIADAKREEGDMLEALTPIMDMLHALVAEVKTLGEMLAQKSDADVDVDVADDAEVEDTQMGDRSERSLKDALAAALKKGQ